MSQTITFHETDIELIARDGDLWITAGQLAEGLGYADRRKLLTLFDRNSDEFSASMTGVLKLRTPGGVQNTRVFSLRGAHLLAMLARTDRARAFRAWVLDLIETEAARRKPTAQHITQINGCEVRVAQIDGETWYAGADLAPVLGLPRRGRVAQLYSRHRKRFASGLSRLARIWAGPEMRMFNHAGVEVLASLTRTPQAVEVRATLGQSSTLARISGECPPKCISIAAETVRSEQSQPCLEPVMPRKDPADLIAISVMGALRETQIALNASWVDHPEDGDPALAEAERQLSRRLLTGPFGGWRTEALRLIVAAENCLDLSPEGHLAIHRLQAILLKCA